jgi:hypothetical protein
MPAGRKSPRGVLVSSWDNLPDEIVLIIFAWIAMGDCEAMLTAVPFVCRRWRALCGDTKGVRLDLTFLPPRAKLCSAGVDAAVVSALVASLASLTTRFKHVVSWNLKRVLAHEPGNHLVVALAEHCALLTNVDFYRCNQLTDTSVVALAEHCPQLTNVNFYNCDQLTDTSVVALAEHCPQLTHVNFSFCNQLTDTSVVALAEHCPLLTNVYFSFCDKLTDTSVVALAEHCPQLTVGKFNNCDHLTEVSRVALAEHCPQLTVGKFNNCDHLTEVSRVALGVRRES